MKRNEVFSAITGSSKWYAGKFSPQTASRILKKHKDGAYNNYDWLFTKFGYKVENEQSWIKDEYKNK